MPEIRAGQVLSSWRSQGICREGQSSKRGRRKLWSSLAWPPVPSTMRTRKDSDVKTLSGQVLPGWHLPGFKPSLQYCPSGACLGTQMSLCDHAADKRVGRLDSGGARATGSWSWSCSQAAVLHRPSRWPRGGQKSATVGVFISLGSAGGVNQSYFSSQKVEYSPFTKAP